MVKGKIDIDFEECKGCQLCISFCPRNTISRGTELNKKGYFPAKFTPDTGRGCNGCTLCAIVCPDVAIIVKREHSSKRGGSL